MPPVHSSNGADLSHIAKDLWHLAVPVESVRFDPHNAVIHPEVNIKGIEESLAQFGQVKPIIVNKATNEVCAGNGTLQAAINLKWKYIAASFQDWDEGTASAFALADNTTSDTRVWDMEQKARLVRLIQEAGKKPVCITDDEILQLRTLEYTPPPLDDSEEDEEAPSAVDVLSETSKEKLAENMVIERAVELCREVEGNEVIARSQALYIICHWYLNNVKKGGK